MSKSTESSGAEEKPTEAAAAGAATSTMKKSSEGGTSPPPKRVKTKTVMKDILSPKVLEVVKGDDIKDQFQKSQPYPHAQIKELFQEDFLLSVKEEIKSQTKVNFKESDLFRVYQSIDMANLNPGTDLADQLPDVMRLREVLYSQEWRSLMERLTGLPPATLTDQIDCACNCHAPGCHLLCHDDVIGTRKISYIIYLTEPDWKPEEGGSLELYGPQLEISDEKETSPLPVSRAWPLFNSMAFFVVRPGYSFHAVQEVLGDRPRLSLQGWYHAAEPPKDIEKATLQQLKKMRADEGENPDSSRLELSFKNEEGEACSLSKADKDYLSQYLKAEYLTDKSMDEIQQKFENDSSVQLRDFLLENWVPKLAPRKPSVYDDNYYKIGISKEWKVKGPAHKQRYLEYEVADKDLGSSNTSSEEEKSEEIVVGDLLLQVKKQVFESEAMARYLKRITSLDKPTGVKSGQVRRFRPALDYTVAHYGLLLDESVLDATMCFVNDETTDEKDVWESGDVGGFECYIEADDEDDDPNGGGAADEYNEDDDTELLSVSASNNTLSLVYRDPGTMRFVKYVGSSAPSSRYDICMEYEVPEGEEEEGEAELEASEAGGEPKAQEE